MMPWNGEICSLVSAFRLAKTLGSSSDNSDFCNMKKIKLIECPRDAMQGWKTFIPTETKIEYINKLLEVGFDTIDFGSFVSPKAIPQLADTKEVLNGLNLAHTNSKLLAIVANVRGAEEAVQYNEISYLGFPFSISETEYQQHHRRIVEDH